MTHWENGEYFISTNKELLDKEAIYQFLSQESYWSKGIPNDIVLKSIENTPLCFGVYKGDREKSFKQVGFARVITDLATYAYLADVFIVPEFRGVGLSKWLMEIITNHQDLKNVRRFMLVTDDAHTLYEKVGFKRISNPELHMEKVRKNPYQS